MLVLAHRGLVGPYRPENTLAAVGAAFAAGADGVEVDLRLTADGVLVLSHDADLRRLAGVSMPVASSSWPELRSAAARGGLRLCRLEEVLALAGGRRLVLEVKGPPPGSDAEGRTAGALVSRLADHQVSGRADVTVSSFAAPLLRRVRQLLGEDSGVRTALLGQPWDPAGTVLARALDGGHDELHPHVMPALRGAPVVEAAHEAGLAVVPWTVNSSRDVQRLRLLGADGVITDVPCAARSAGAAVRHQPRRPHRRRRASLAGRHG